MILGIYGSGGLGREVLDIVIAGNRVKEKYTDIVFIDDNKSKQIINGYNTLTFDEFSGAYKAENAGVVIGVGEPKVRMLMSNKVRERGFELETVVHPAADVSRFAQIGKGCVICFSSFISTGVIIKDNAYIQLNTCIGHDTVIGHSSVISPLASISGGCIIGDETYIGMSVPIREKVVIGSEVIIGMGAVVLKDIPDRSVAYGNPAKVVRTNDSLRVFR